MIPLKTATPAEMRLAIRNGEFVKPTAGLCPGYAQGNLVVLPKDLAYDFLLFAQRNPKPCPILDVTEVGSREMAIVAPGSDIAKDIPKYRVYENGVYVQELEDVSGIWRDDFVAFLLGCSFSFESALMQSNIEVRHITAGSNVPMYITNMQCRPAGVFSGPTVVSMRPIPYHQVVKAAQITARFPAVHGAPVHIGDPAQIGIQDISKPDFGDAVEIKPGEVPVFWACGVTPQAVAMQSKPPIMLTHAPGYMFITDLQDHEFAAF